MGRPRKGWDRVWIPVPSDRKDELKKRFKILAEEKEPMYMYIKANEDTATYRDVARMFGKRPHEIKRYCLKFDLKLKAESTG